MSKNRRSNFKPFLLGAVVGAVVGAITALLCAPDSGKEIRRKVKNKGEKIKEKLDKLVQESGSLAQEWKGNWGKLAEIISTLEDQKPNTSDNEEGNLNTEEKVEMSPKETEEEETPTSKETKKKKRPRFFKGI